MVEKVEEYNGLLDEVKRAKKKVTRNRREVNPYRPRQQKTITWKGNTEEETLRRRNAKDERMREKEEERERRREEGEEEKQVLEVNVYDVKNFFPNVEREEMLGAVLEVMGEIWKRRPEVRYF